MRHLARNNGDVPHFQTLGRSDEQRLAEAMLAGRLKEHPFAAFDFPELPLGLSGGSPWFLPLAGLWYRMLDLVE